MMEIQSFMDKVNTDLHVIDFKFDVFVYKNYMSFCLKDIQLSPNNSNPQSSNSWIFRSCLNFSF